MKTKLKSVVFLWAYFLIMFLSAEKEPAIPAKKLNIELHFEYPQTEMANYSQYILMYADSRVKINLVSDLLPQSTVCEDTCCARIRNGIIYAENEGITTLYDGQKRVRLCVFKKNTNIRKQYQIVVYKGTQTVVIYTSDYSGKYNVPVRCMPCSTGIEGENETVCGEYSVINHYRWRLLYGPCYGQYGTSFSKDYLFHSMPYKEQKPNTGYDFELLGTKSSHGCIRLSVADAKWIYENCDTGSLVAVTDESRYEANITVALNKDKRYSGWDPTDTDEKNPYLTDGLMYIPITASYADKITMLSGEKVKMDIKTTAKKLTFTSDNPHIAIADSNGVVTATGKGCCTVYVMGDDGSYFNASITVK